MSIEELVKKFSDGGIRTFSLKARLRAALTEQAETHALELRAYEATVQNLEERIRQMEGELAESQKRIRQLAAEHERKQALLLEAHCERVSSLQERIRQLEAQRVPEGDALVSIESLSDALGDIERAVDWLSSAQTVLSNLLSAAPAPKEGE